LRLTPQSFDWRALIVATGPPGGAQAERAALRWWLSNVAKIQCGLQGWKRHKVYPDFVVGVLSAEGQTRTVVMEAKGLHLAGADTTYKQALPERLTRAFGDERGIGAGRLELAVADTEDVVCDLVFDQGWRGTAEKRWFSASDAERG
jgi:type III restriction enzyme